MLCIRFSVAAGLLISATLVSPAGATVSAAANAGSNLAIIPIVSVRDDQPVSASAVAHSFDNTQFALSAADAFAYADLRTGKMGASASSTILGNASAVALMSERLRFSIGGADNLTRTTISFRFGYDGVQFGDTPGEPSVAYFGYGASIGQYIRGSYAGGAYYSVSSQVSRNGTVFNAGSGGWLTESVSTIGGVNYFNATFELIGANPEIAFDSSLSAGSTWTAYSDFSRTSSVSLLVPQNVSYTSQSGEFLSAAAPPLSVPEPASWMMMIVGFGTLGVAMRRSQVVKATLRFS